jgi:hypothetical protein
MQLCFEFVESLNFASRLESAVLPRLTDAGVPDSEESTQSNKESMSESSDDEPRNAHVLGDKTMVEDGIVDTDVRDSVINVAPNEGQVHCVCTSTRMLRKWQTWTFLVVVLGQLTNIRTNSFAMWRCGM